MLLTIALNVNIAKLMESKRQKTFTPKGTAPLLSIVLIFSLPLFPNLFEADASEIFLVPCVENIKIENNSKESTMRLFGMDASETSKIKKCRVNTPIKYS